MEITKQTVAAKLADVERLATEDFRRAGYEPAKFLSIVDLGHNGRYRSWNVTATVYKLSEQEAVK